MMKALPLPVKKRRKRDIDLLLSGYFSKILEFLLWTLWNLSISQHCAKICHNTEFFLILIFLYSVQVRVNTDQKNLHIWTLFTQFKLLSTAMFLSYLLFLISLWENNEIYKSFV